MDNAMPEFPDMSDFTKYLSIINNETDRGCALIAAGYIEELLGETLKAFMVDMKFVENDLVGEMKPLGSLSARNLACRALGLISEDEFKDIDKIRRIRNDFAHEINASFQDQDLIAYCNSLIFKKSDFLDENGRKNVMSPAVQFRTGANAIILRLVMRPRDASLRRCKAIDWGHYLQLSEPLDAIGTKIEDMSEDIRQSQIESRK